MLSLTGRATAPLGPPAGLIPGVDVLGAAFPDIDPLALLGERAALLGLSRGGTTSCGGGCHLLATADGWIALSLARPEDIASLPAWLGHGGVPEPTDAMWAHVERAVSARPAADLVERGVLLDLPIAAVDDPPPRSGVRPVPFGPSPPTPDPRGLMVVDLTALWAGPLCGDLLARAGAQVIKVESTSRPDGARRGPSEFFDLLNGHKRSVALDFRVNDDVAVLARLLRRADVVLEASRPRALAQLGLGAEMLMGTEGGPRVWVSITGYGREGADANRVAFGDDAAAAAGLVVHEEGAPRFCGDAVADPLSGLAAAGASRRALEGGGRWLLDVSMAAVAATMTGPTVPVSDGVTMAMPSARPITHRAPALGADTERVLQDLDLSP